MTVFARITFYVLVGVMANGHRTHPGAVACSYDIPLGSVVTIGAEQYTCEDRGVLGSGSPYSWIDIWVSSYDEGYALINRYGDFNTVIVGDAEIGD